MVAVGCLYAGLFTICVRRSHALAMQRCVTKALRFRMRLIDCGGSGSVSPHTPVEWCLVRTEGACMRPLMADASVAFIILTWNSQRYIGDCLKSVLGLPFKELKVYVVDNGSQDDSLKIIRTMSQNDPRVELIALETNEGTTKPRNLALKRIPHNTDYVCVLDSDTEVNAKAFQTLTERLAQDTDGSIGVIGPHMHNRKGEWQLSGRNLSTLSIKLRKACPISSVKQRGAQMEIPQTPVVDHLQDVGYLLSACWFMPYSTIQKVGLLDENIFYAPEDVDYCVRVHQAGLRVVFCDSAEIMHDYQRLSHKKLISKTNMKHIGGLVYYFKKYSYLFNAEKIYK